MAAKYFIEFDGINKILKEIACIISIKVAFLINLSFEKGIFPSVLK